jgi:hypothetical protein
LFLKLFSILFNLTLDFVIVVTTHKKESVVRVAVVAAPQGPVGLTVVWLFQAIAPGIFGNRSLTGGAAGAAIGSPPIPMGGGGGIAF